MRADGRVTVVQDRRQITRWWIWGIWEAVLVLPRRFSMVDTTSLEKSNDGSPAGDMDRRRGGRVCEVKASSRIFAPIQVKSAVVQPAPYRSR